ncbi:MAG: PAS domain S-box protein, partial [Myxococcales bacterium]|nr:PAS domain S-box protein [Myxococcales bacterium]
VNPRTREIRWTEGMYRIVGLEPGSVVTPEIALERMHVEDRDRQLAWWRRVADGESLDPIRLRAVRADGEERVTLTHGARLDVGGDPRLIGTTMDVTERVQLEERLRQAAKMEAVGALAAGLAHDFNNFLTIIGGNVEIALRSPEKAERVLTDVMQAVDRSASLTRQLLAFARQQPARPAVVDLGRVV